MLRPVLILLAAASTEPAPARQPEVVCDLTPNLMGTFVGPDFHRADDPGPTMLDVP